MSELHDLIYAASEHAYAHCGDPGFVCGTCDTLWSRVAPLRRFGDQACPNCGDLYPGTNQEP